jgi:hypothetical protein
VGPTGSTSAALTYSVSLTKAIGDGVFITGDNYSVATTQTDLSYNTPFGPSNNHVLILLNSFVLSASGPYSISFTGTLVSEETGVPVTFTETLTIIPTASKTYQSLKKWLYVSNITFNNFTSVNYNISKFGYFDFGNKNFKITGYRAEILSGTGTTSDITLLIQNVKYDATTGETQLIQLENLEISALGGTNSNGFITDSLRSTRTFNMPTGGVNLWSAQTTFVAKQTDFNSYFSTGQNIIYGANNGGLILQVTGIDLGTTNHTQFINWTIFYDLI